MHAPSINNNTSKGEWELWHRLNGFNHVGFTLFCLLTLYFCVSDERLTIGLSVGIPVFVVLITILSGVIGFIVYRCTRDKEKPTPVRVRNYLLNGSVSLVLCQL